MELEIKEIVTGFNTDGKVVKVLFNISPSAYKLSVENEHFVEIITLLANSYKNKVTLDLKVNLGTQEIMEAKTQP